MDTPKQIDLFPTSEPEIKGLLIALAFVLRGLIEALKANGQLTDEQVHTLLTHSDIKTVFAIWNESPQGTPSDELKRMQEQAMRFLEMVRSDIFG